MSYRQLIREQRYYIGSYTKKWISEQCKMTMAEKLVMLGVAACSVKKIMRKACRRYKDRRTKLPERQRYHAYDGCCKRHGSSHN